MLGNKIKALGQDYIRDTKGQFTLWFSMLAVPLMVGTTYVFDYRMAEAERSHIKSALDAAVLASVSDVTHTSDKRRDLAEQVFKAQYTGNVPVHLKVTISTNGVEMNAAGVKEASLAKSVGSKGFKINETSAAVLDFAAPLPPADIERGGRVALPKGAGKADYAEALDLMSRSGEFGNMTAGYSEADVLKALNQLGLSANVAAAQRNMMTDEEARTAQQITNAARKSKKNEKVLRPSDTGPRLTE